MNFVSKCIGAEIEIVLIVFFPQCFSTAFYFKQLLMLSPDLGNHFQMWKCELKVWIWNVKKSIFQEGRNAGLYITWVFFKSSHYVWLIIVLKYPKFFVTEGCSSCAQMDQ